jgi:PIN domain nuclease of toxin-antitoxin system
MRFLLDTHPIIWDILGDPRLGQETKAILFSREAAIWMSAVSVWEIATKVSVGKLRLGRSLNEVVEWAARRIRSQHLPITVAHALALADLPLHHKDPFDRILVAQARVEGLTIVTADEALFRYDVPTLDARK